MSATPQLRQLGLFDARVPRYTSYPPANHFNTGIGPDDSAAWMRAIPEGSLVSLYLHIPYCRRLCWFCACRTQGTATTRPLRHYLDVLKAELTMVAKTIPTSVKLSHIHLGGGTPTLLEPEMIDELGDTLRAFRPLTEDAQVSVEIDPTEVDRPRIDALVRLGMTRASIGVQDFNTYIQETIGRIQSYADTRDVVQMLRDAGVTSLNMDILYGLPHQTTERIAESVQRVLSLAPDRVALFGYAHVPWMAKRQALIPSEALPTNEARLELFDTARQLFEWDGYRQIGIDHFAHPEDSLSLAQDAGTMRRNFQGYTEDSAPYLIGVGASAISQYPQGYAHNAPATATHQIAIEAGRFSTARGHRFTREDIVRGAMIEALMCDFKIDLEVLSNALNEPVKALHARLIDVAEEFSEVIKLTSTRFLIRPEGHPLARIIAKGLDPYEAEKTGHSPAI
ncbi:MAG: oxygen-independent coproporphyrinogen III oxidase [Pseudomonadota bacterium]